MGIQSAIMAWQFGSNFQAGKRWISAMDNNTFNKLTPTSLMIDNTNAIREMIPTMQDSLGMMTPLVKTVILEFGKMITEAFDVLNPFKDNNGFNFWDPEFNIFNLRKNLPFVNPDPTFIGPPTNPNPPGPLLSLTRSQISAANDQVLASWIRNINDYDTQTQKWLLEEQKRRQTRVPPKIPAPTPPQQNTKLDPAFVATLTETDLRTGGARTRMTGKWGLQKWKGTHKFTYSNSTLQRFNWTGTWAASTILKNLHITVAIAHVNDIKRTTGSSYVVQFKRGTNAFRWYLISDNF